MPTTTRSRRSPVVGIALILCVVALGLGSRRFGRHLPWFLAAYAGDTLWATAAFLGLGLLRPAASTRSNAVAALAVSFLVELSQLYHAPWIDAVRRTTPGALLLGSGFLASDLACYVAGVGLGAGLDLGIARLRDSPGTPRFRPWRRRRP